MDSFEWNKIAGGLIAGTLLVLLINIAGHSIYEDEPLEKNAYVVEGVEDDAAASGPAEKKPEGPSLAVLLSEANAEDGAKVFKKCATCHNVNKGEGAKTGPDLYGTVGNKVAGHDGFNYSDAFRNHGGTWDFAKLDQYLESPKGYIPGNKMSFAGLKKPEERAAVLLFLNQHSDNPLPLPTPEAPAADAPDAGQPAADEAKS